MSCELPVIIMNSKSEPTLAEEARYVARKVSPLHSRLPSLSSTCSVEAKLSAVSDDAAFGADCDKEIPLECGDKPDGLRKRRGVDIKPITHKKERQVRRQSEILFGRRGSKNYLDPLPTGVSLKTLSRQISESDSPGARSLSPKFDFEEGTRSRRGSLSPPSLSPLPGGHSDPYKKHRRSASVGDLRTLAVAPLLVEKWRSVPKATRQHLCALPDRHDIAGHGKIRSMPKYDLTPQDIRGRKMSTTDAKENDLITPKDIRGRKMSTTAAKDKDVSNSVSPKESRPDTSKMWSKALKTGDVTLCMNEGSRAETPNDEGNAGTTQDSRTCSDSPDSEMEAQKQKLSIKGFRSMKDVRDRHMLFTEDEVSRAFQAFNRFLPCDSTEIRRRNLGDILVHLGYIGVKDKKVMEIAKNISSFDTLGFDEVLVFLERYATHERGLLEEEFKSNSDGIERISVQNLLQTMRDLGCCPLSATVREMLHQLGFDGSMLNLQEFVDFLALYRSTEGCLHDELLKARAVFSDMTKSSEIKVSELATALVGIFGPFAAPHVDDLLKTLQSTKSGNSPDSKGLTPGSKIPGITLHELVIWIRRLRDITLNELFQHFSNADVDDDGYISSEDELIDFMSDVGFTIFQSALDEFMEEAGIGHVSRIDFDQCVKVVRVCRSHAGFRDSEVKKYHDVFKKFDYNDNGEMDPMEILDLVRYLGYTTTLEDVHRFLRHADANFDGAMDFPEFLRLMRLFREDELNLARQVFNTYSDADSGGVPIDCIPKALHAFDLRPEEDMVTSIITAMGQQHTLHFDSFVSAADRCRRLCAEETRRRASFSQREFRHYQDAFKQRANVSSNSLQKGEFLWLAIDEGMEINTLEDREETFRMLDEARVAAVNAGVKPEDAGEVGSQVITFWALLHFLRTWRRKTEGYKVGEEERVIDETRFTRAEIIDFRELFMQWVEKSSAERNAVEKHVAVASELLATSGQANRNTTRRATVSDVPDLSVQAGSVEKPTDQRILSVKGSDLSIEGNSRLPLKGLRNLLSSIGLQFSPKQRDELEGQVVKIAGRYSGGLEFPAFLRLMRWMLDSNFADINGVAKRVVEKAQPQSLSPLCTGTTQASPLTRAVQSPPTAACSDMQPLQVAQTMKSRARRSSIA